MTTALAVLGILLGVLLIWAGLSWWFIEPFRKAMFRIYEQ